VNGSRVGSVSMGASICLSRDARTSRMARPGHAIYPSRGYARGYVALDVAARTGHPERVTDLPATHPYLADLDAEAQGWRHLVEIVRSLTLEQRLAPGYYVDPVWSVRDVVGHIGTWLAEAGVQFERLQAGTYEGHDVDIDGLNATFLEAMRDQPWDVTWTQANAGRTRMRQAWTELREPSEEAAWWIRKSGVDHYEEHLDRLEEWVGELRRHAERSR